MDGERSRSLYEHLGDGDGAAVCSCLQVSDYGEPMALMSDNVPVVVYIKKPAHGVLCNV